MAATVQQRFWSATLERPDGCWVWRRKLDRLGYGWLSVNGKLHLAHRVAWRLFRGEIRSEQHLDHLCRNRDCVNPDHLEVVSHRENVLRGIGPTAVNAAKTECIHGHPLSGDNLYMHPTSGQRVCIECRNNYKRAWRRRHGTR